ncbi:hypothetical protein CTAYLR_006183 [Chrysophaeum taylorii]|uniref:Uncharacterized protein n=1 Tax=Chrysophaeum taylorii TaxID=2483200 RepID=A0AAD7UML0_9STRA|nr:hypothetical protein CTAYLR_006183 [Chrysophaeum taylorii]
MARGNKKKRKRKKNEEVWDLETVVPGEDPSEVAHMVQFFLCQLRWQFGSFGDFSEFDAEMDRIGGSEDVRSCGGLMETFFRGPARGDRWVPWHTTTCEQELFLMRRIRTLKSVSEAERFCLCCAFSACRCIPVWETCVLPNIEPPVTPEFFESSKFLEGLFEFRKRGNKLHTSAFNCYPPRGASGDEFVRFIASRHVHFANIGVAAFPLITGNAATLDALDKCFRSFDRVGPTMSKVLLITTHLWYPELGILRSGCEVGDGARQAFEFLYPDGFSDVINRRDVLQHLYDYLTTTPVVDQRLPRMIEWVCHKTRARFPEIPEGAIADRMTIYDLQVQLCEWRKFRRAVDPKRTIKKGTILSL